MTAPDSPTVSASALGLDAIRLLDMYRLMYTIRRFEQTMERAHQEGGLYGPFHSSMGQEAVAVGACAPLASEDVVVSTHRGHGHVIAKGAQVPRICAELAGKSTGYCGGKGGSMHIVSVDDGIIGQNPIIGGSEFLATGAALAFQLSNRPQVAVAFFGDGAVGQGVFHETLNLAAVWKLPVVFVAENNGFAHSFRSEDMQVGDNIASRASSYGMPGVVVDGTDTLAVFEATAAAVERARSGEGPTLIEAKCYRWKGHNLGDADHLYRSRDEVEAARQNDPLAKFRAATVDQVTSQALADIEAEVDIEIEQALEFALTSPAPDPTTALEGSL